MPAAPTGRRTGQGALHGQRPPLGCHAYWLHGTHPANGTLLVPAARHPTVTRSALGGALP